ncbi:MAG: hypothetical protein F2690_00750 [Actinobacteria bacterium]|uniref:Unannotated protein n=1 Tax=freshwater metagenome TaxID=449393 RepID=A0A6J6Z755_9ZZZZ|nr:hypothetical protein [Actinomycetota bacterium]MSX71583.1 hypothetical protein [Actinomycetota bacterium]MSY69087.1 hypothetical protein [Actinomycetota bacterium]MTA75528.1 hypothetical protein [Actinomycetota bacterium]
MNKVKVIFMALVLVLMPVSAISAQKVSAGGSCKALGQKVTYSKKVYTCVKSGKKTVWNKGVAVSSTPTATPTPTKTAAPFVAKIPITLPVAQTGEITFENVMSHISDIPKTAWQKVQDVIASNSAGTIKHDTYVGPNTQLTITGGKAGIDSILEKATKLWAGFTMSKYYSVVYYNITDEKWAEQKTQDIWKVNGYGSDTIGSALNALSISCQSQSAPGVGGAALGFCRGGDAGAVTNSDNSFIQMAEGDIERPDTNGSKLVHEFTHTVQSAQWIGNANCHNEGNNCFRTGLAHDFTPCWINEGQPNGINTMVANSDFSSYFSSRSFGKDPGQNVTDYSAGSIRDYLYNQSPTTCYRNGPLYQLGFDLGAKAIEALVAIGGPQATMALFALGAEGQDFPTAFKNVYGISWSDASTILSKVLAAEYSN